MILTFDLDDRTVFRCSHWVLNLASNHGVVVHPEKQGRLFHHPLQFIYVTVCHTFFQFIVYTVGLTFLKTLFDTASSATS